MKPIPLSPIDHVFTGVGSYPIEFVFAYQETLNTERMQSSLNKVLGYFPPPQCHLVKISEHSLGLTPAPDGLILQVTDSQTTFDEANDRSVFLDPVHSVEGEPLARIRLTHTPQGSVLGVGISHAVADGFSYFHFLTSWARIFHGKSVLNPDHRRKLLMRELPHPLEPVSSDELLSHCGIFRCEKRRDFDQAQVNSDHLNFSKQTLDGLLAEAARDCDRRLTYNDVITAHLWLRYLPLWNRDDSPTYVSVPFDFRRILSKFPRTYFGCAVCLAVASTDNQTLVNASLGELASLVRQAVLGVNEKRVHTALTTLERVRLTEGLSAIKNLHVLHPHHGLLVTNLSRLPIQDIAFNCGPPIAFDVLAPAARGAVILPSPDGLDVRVYHPLKD